MRSARELIARAGRPWHAIRSFTLLETLVAVGALAFVAAGIAVIFENTGKTITTGKRVSVFNAAAAAIEQRLRTDIASMTREGFLLIRNEFANPGTTNPVPLYEGDTNQRQRRTDELMFFAKGEFESARVPLFAGLTPRSDAARIYYGHGTRWKRPTLPANPNDPYLKPDLNNVNQGQLQLGYNDPNNPNRYASDWTLLRQVTLLCRPQPSDRVLPQNAPAWLTDQTIKDTSIQVALQPAASDIFRRINSGILPAGFGSEIRQTVLHPVFASGLVDVATTDLTTIRAVVTTADNGPGTANAQFYIPLQNQQADGGNAGPDGQYKQDSATNDVVDRAHSWILDALPAESHSTALSDFARVRYEPAPTNVAQVLLDGFQGVTLDPETEWRRADQLMLAASNFAPHCSEFIVEWSFGNTYPMTNTSGGYVAGREGDLVWHGLDRTPSQGAPQGVDMAHWYGRDPAIDTVGVAFPRVNGTTGGWGTTPWLIHALPNGAQPPVGGPLNSFFGYVDPTFTPDQDPPGGDGKLDKPLDAKVTSIPWVWPRFIRITMSLTDPADPSYEKTFQFVFDVPQDAAK